METSGSSALPGPRPQRRPTRARTPRARGNGVPESAALTSAFPDAESLSGRRLGVRAFQTSRNCRCPLATVCPLLTPSPPCAPVLRPRDSSLGRGCLGRGAAHGGLGFRLTPLPPHPRTRPRPERGRRRAPRRPEGFQGRTRPHPPGGSRPGQGTAPPPRVPGLCGPAAGGQRQGARAAAPASGAEGILAVNVLQECK